MKYGNKRCACRSGHVHMSRLEAAHCDRLALLLKAGEIGAYRTQYKLELKVNGKLIANHYVDFAVFDKAGQLSYFVESKGFDTDAWRLKRKLVEALYPDIEYRVWRM